MSRVQKSEKENDQAGELRSRIERQKAKSSLPKRSKVHQNKKKKSKVKKFPMIQLLALFFILLPIGFYTLYTYLQDRPVPVTKSDQVVFSEEPAESIPTTATADDLKEKESSKAEAEKEKEEAKVKAQQEAEEKAKAQQEAEEKAKAQREAEEKAKAQQEAEEKAKAQQEAAEKAKAQQIADEKAKKAESEKKKAADQAAKPDKEGYKVVLHTVQGEETLFRISMNYYKSQEGIALIREWNGLNGNEISKGQVLKIPIKK
ncbi:LysM peptidoglycan-binding domain-containing protein [Peribacillus simplex]|uniref:LysM peptidoglycan-binding domain-containing protein n=1 Tax=Peribacillus simplex TaxID=1478 RepID=UPI0024C1A46B|nr:LysM peptidoglycan-binding domain-containing protein [Peribacillus simplex]WHY54946.1 LysM peptidoglycan-binding domain-containing protein [Peribacillus simplex]